MILLIKPYRLMRRLNLKALSELTGLSIGYLSQLENNKGNPTLSTIDKIGKALKICPLHLFAGCNNKYCTLDCYHYKDYYTNYNNLPPETKEHLKRTIIRLKSQNKL